MNNQSADLRDIALGKSEFSFVDEKIRQKAAEAVKKGIDCILKCQIVVKGKKTVWCAQHDEKTLEPCKARCYELASLSGGESFKIIRFLMMIESPTREVTEAIESAVAWFDKTKIVGIRVKRVKDISKPKGWDRIVVQDSSSPPMWARFYEIETNKPFFVVETECPSTSFLRFRMNAARDIPGSGTTLRACSKKSTRHGRKKVAGTDESHGRDCKQPSQEWWF